MSESLSVVASATHVTEPSVRSGWLDLSRSGAMPPDIRTAILVGSRARGWAHAASDIDVSVVTRAPFRPGSSVLQPTHLSDPEIAVMTTELAGVRWEVKFWTEAQVSELFDRVSWSQFDPSTRPDLSGNEHFLLQRLPHGRPLDAEWEPLTQVLASEVRGGAFYSAAALGLMAECDGDLEDVAGLIAVGDHYSAVSAAIRAYHAAVDAFTAARGDPGSEDKWRRRRVGAVDSVALPVDLFWELETLACYSEATPRRWLDRVVRTCQHLLMQTRVGSPLAELAVMDELPARAYSSPVGRTARLADGVTVRTFRDHSFLARGDHAVEVADTGQVMIARLLRGDSVTEVAAAIAAQVDADAEEIASDVADFLSELIDAGFLAEEPA